MADGDYEKIARLLTTYNRAIDAKDWDRYEAVFAPEAVIDYTGSGGIRGSRSEARAWVSQAMAGFAISQHVLANHDVVVEADVATAHSDFFGPVGKSDDAGGFTLLFVGGAYHDKLRRTGDGWLITERVEEMKWWSGEWPEEVPLGQ
jgi:ketosteroid isomerase-like protein